MIILNKQNDEEMPFALISINLVQDRKRALNLMLRIAVYVLRQCTFAIFMCVFCFIIPMAETYRTQLILVTVTAAMSSDIRLN